VNNNFPSSVALFHPFPIQFHRAKVFILLRSNMPVFPLMDYAFGVKSTDS
jgi:hypothetical protein